jgi:hypothetical protein
MYAGIQDRPRDEQVQILIELGKNPMTPSMSLLVPPDAVTYLACPEHKQGDLREALAGTDFEAVSVKPI